MQCNAVSDSELMEASGAIGENGGACGDIEDHFVVEFISSVSHILIILTLDVKTDLVMRGRADLTRVACLQELCITIQ